MAATGHVVYIGWAKEAVTYETKLFILKELEIQGFPEFADGVSGCD